ncbi:hypothetical protein NQ318_011476 [Aromia moschata]|uniref:Uncharacterized protein n=1 Tax=Aromia moschata TaxID=1265417 RepID=A0AAV8XMH6_9CUCU|nr:hypothetical protein NQ318_011476 [Aromia moschata]
MILLFQAMWFEIIPAFSIVCASMAAPHYLAYVLNSLVVGNCFRRKLETREQRMQYLRDRRLADNPYEVLGLDRLKDECECDEEGNKESECECECECNEQDNNKME